MVLDAWVMIGGWGFLDEFEVDRFLDMMETARASHLAFGVYHPCSRISVTAAGAA